MTIPALFDRSVRHLRSRRAHIHGPGNIAMQRLAEDMADRLAAVMRDFETAVDLGSPHEAIEQVLHAYSRVQNVIYAGPARKVAPETRAVTANEEMLPFGQASIDLIVSALALQDVNDLPGLLAQVRQALRPDGLFMAVWAGGDTLMELREAFAQAEAELTGGITPRVFPRMDIRDAGALMQRAGFALPVVDKDVIMVRYSSIFGLFKDLRMLGTTNILHARSKRPLSRKLLARLAEIYHERYSDPDGRLRVTVELLWVSGWAPHESQQKPMAPGSAQTRLADALKRREF
jgi:SAM-dependent methyltransferase